VITGHETQNAIRHALLGVSGFVILKEKGERRKNEEMVIVVLVVSGYPISQVGVV
jgi:hypothetical protein